MRLIDADALKYELFADNYSAKMTNQEVAECIDNSPTIDAVVVVRCEECEAYQPTEGGKPFCVVHQIAVCKNDYCSRGTKMESEGST